MFGHPTRMFLCFSSISCFGPQIGLTFLNGNSVKYREIDVVERVQVIGRRKCQGLIGLHNFSGTDWGGKFVGISKKIWVVVNLKFDENDDATNCFRELGEGASQW